MNEEKIPPKVQAGEITYELHSLGWKAFQSLCVTLTGEVWGQVIQSFFDSHDGGRDGAFHGTWKPTVGEVYEGTFTTQCKFTAQANKCLHISDLKDELAKAERLAERGLADNYFLFTNARLTGLNEEEIRAKFESIPNIKRFAAFGCERISQIIHESPRLRMLVPRVYGLGDLSQILDERAYAQAREILSALGDDLAKFVITDAHKKSAKALVEYGFVLLLGEPACGKSTIAAALAVGAIDEWDCSTVKVRDADDFIRHSNPHEKQFFWVDDAFGATQLDWNSVVAWNRVFPHIQAAIHRGAKVLFTSRDYIYRASRPHLKETALPIIKESQVVIQVENLSKEEREQILYNHIRLGTQPKEYKKQLKPFLSNVATNHRFSPETARRLGSPIFTKQLIVSEAGLRLFVEQPLEHLCEIITTLDSDCHAALALVFMSGGTLLSPVELSADEEKAIALLDANVGGVRTALNALNGSFLLLLFQNGRHVWRFKHPTIRDAFAKHVAEDNELLDIYLAGTPVERLFQEVSCGQVGLEGVKVIVPISRYDSLINRINKFLDESSSSNTAIHRFLSYRCDKDFLARYIAVNPNFISSLRVYSYLYAVSDVDVIARLHEVGLLPEHKRVEAVKTIRELAVETPDSGFLQGQVRNLFSEEEFAGILSDIKLFLLPELDNIIDNWASNYCNGDEPEGHFSELTSALVEYSNEFAEDWYVSARCKSAIAKIESVIEDIRSEMPPEPDSDEYYGGSSENTHELFRSIFEDVDS